MLYQSTFRKTGTGAQDRIFRAFPASHDRGLSATFRPPRMCRRGSRMPFYIISILLPVIALVHLVRTGRNMMWITVIVFLPVAGPIAYFIAEMLPSFRQS